MSSVGGWRGEAVVSSDHARGRRDESFILGGLFRGTSLERTEGTCFWIGMMEGPVLQTTLSTRLLLNHLPSFPARNIIPPSQSPSEHDMTQKPALCAWRELRLMALAMLHGVGRRAGQLGGETRLYPGRQLGIQARLGGWLGRRERVD